MAEQDGDEPRVLGEEIIHDGFVRLSRVRLELPWQGERREVAREIHDHGDVAAVFPVDPDRRVGLLIRQFRAAAYLSGDSGWLWEIPAGLLEGKAPESCARQEAQEECGVAIQQIEPLGLIWTSPGIVKERCHLFWGRYAGTPRDSIGGLDTENEMIEVHEKPLSEIMSMLDGGTIADAKSAVALYRLRVARPELLS